MRKTGIWAVVCAAAMAAGAETVVDVTSVGEKEKTSVSINVTGQSAAAYAATLASPRAARERSSPLPRRRRTTSPRAWPRAA